jgi:hypothetical protein
MTHTETDRLAKASPAASLDTPELAHPMGSERPWREGLAALNLLIGTGALFVAGWGLLVCDAPTGACRALAWALPIGALYALSGLFVGQSLEGGHWLAIALKAAALALVGLFAVFYTGQPEADGWPLAAGAILLAELAALGLCPPGKCEPCP